MSAYHHRSLFVGDIKTHFLEAGQGPELILLHGGEYGASAEITWKHNIGSLAERFHVIAPDMLGWGGTDKIYNFSDPAGYRINHLRRLFDLLGIHQAFFVGNFSRRRHNPSRCGPGPAAVANPENGYHLRQRQCFQDQLSSRSR